MGTEIENWLMDLDYEQWMPLQTSGPRPSSRYKHAAAVFDEKLYVVGGSRGGRYLSDFQVFDLRNLTWSTIKPKIQSDSKTTPVEVFPSVSGHSMIQWGVKLLLVAGLSSKNVTEKVTVRFIDLELHTTGTVETSGDIPVARSGQSATLFGSKLVMFGGEDRKRRLLNDVHVLDLETMTWKSVAATKNAPSPRYDHSATLHAERYLYIFGGCSHSVFFNDIHLLDLETMEWSLPQTQSNVVSPRAGHASVAIRGNWYIVGGGDNRSGLFSTGASETLVIGMSKLVVSVLATVKKGSPLASEGVSLSSAWIGGENVLIAFGGYNGKYYNEVFAMRLKKPMNCSKPKMVQSPAAAAAAASVSAAYALTEGGQISNHRKDVSDETVVLEEEKDVLRSSVAEAAAQTCALRAKLDGINENCAELSKVRVLDSDATDLSLGSFDANE
ncbi:hypothetical protein M569_11319, partial [Genlisea aurea]